MNQIPLQPARSEHFLRATLRNAAVLCICMLGAAGCGTTSTPDQKLDNALVQDMNDYLSLRATAEHISALSMTVIFRGGAQDINVSTGTTQYGGGAAVTPANVFQTGSNTKAFTAVAILQLEAAGLLSIDDTVGKWLPQYPQYAKVTIKQLLNMTSGIPSYSNNAAWQEAVAKNPMAEPTPEGLIHYISSEPVRKPGAAYDYSNTNYILAQLIIDKVSPSHSYETDIDNIIRKSDLQNTFYQPYFYPSSVTPRLVSGYYVNDDDRNDPLYALYGNDTSGYSLGWAQAAGGMIATPEDQARWARDLFEGNVLPPKQLQELESLVSTKTGQPISSTSPSDPAGFGLGVFEIMDPNVGVFWGYQGSTIGYRATYEYFPKNGLIICIFTNSQTSTAQNKIIAQLFPKVYTTLKSAGYVPDADV